MDQKQIEEANRRPTNEWFQQQQDQQRKQQLSQDGATRRRPAVADSIASSRPSGKLMDFGASAFKRWMVRVWKWKSRILIAKLFRCLLLPLFFILWIVLSIVEQIFVGLYFAVGNR